MKNDFQSKRFENVFFFNRSSTTQFVLIIREIFLIIDQTEKIAYYLTSMTGKIENYIPRLTNIGQT